MSIILLTLLYLSIACLITEMYYIQIYDLNFRIIKITLI